MNRELSSLMNHIKVKPHQIWPEGRTNIDVFRANIEIYNIYKVELSSNYLLRSVFNVVHFTLVICCFTNWRRLTVVVILTNIHHGDVAPSAVSTATTNKNLIHS